MYFPEYRLSGLHTQLKLLIGMIDLCYRFYHPLLIQGPNLGHTSKVFSTHLRSRSVDSYFYSEKGHWWR
jgi:hypothetical protein